MRALVIDDSRVARTLLAGMLQSLGLEVAEAGGGREGLERLRQPGKVDLVLVDHFMPDMDGIEVIRAVRADPNLGEARLVLVTGEQDVSYVRRALEAGADGSLHKPFTAEALRATLGRLSAVPG